MFELNTYEHFKYIKYPTTKFEMDKHLISDNGDSKEKKQNDNLWTKSRSVAILPLALVWFIAIMYLLKGIKGLLNKVSEDVKKVFKGHLRGTEHTSNNSEDDIVSFMTDFILMEMVIYFYVVSYVIISFCYILLFILFVTSVYAILQVFELIFALVCVFGRRCKMI